MNIICKEKFFNETVSKTSNLCSKNFMSKIVYKSLPKLLKKKKIKKKSRKLILFFLTILFKLHFKD